jgi:hypothetical protein
MRSIDLVACHLIGDYVLQTDEMAKKKLADVRVRAVHVAWYHVPFLAVGIITKANPARLAAFLALSAAAHFATDSKRWLPNDEWPPGTIINDQALHAAQLAVLGRILKEG